MLMVNLRNEVHHWKQKHFNQGYSELLSFKEKWEKRLPFLVSAPYSLASKCMFMIIHRRHFNSHSFVQ